MTDNKRNDGGPAFPIIDVSQSWNRDTQDYDGVETSISASGMTLRDYFAAKVLDATDWGSTNVSKFTDEQLQSVAHQFYRIADAMLAERDR